MFKMRILLILNFSILFISCETVSKSKFISGYNLGTNYKIKHDSPLDNDSIKIGIDSIFIKINQSMSTYQLDSDISKINEGFKIKVDSFFKEVYFKSYEVWRLTNGAFDPTVGSLVDAYGFGPNKKTPKILSENQLDSLLKITGFDKIYLNEDGVLIKKNKGIVLDFNAIAKGYTVDLISKYLESLGASNYLVEIGGEISAKGLSPKSNRPWKIGIDFPQSNQNKRIIYDTYFLYNRSMATSGNYRHVRIIESTGKKYVHTVDPRTGNSIESNILSVSVIADDCMTADAWATSLMVLSFDEGKEIIENDKTLEAFWILSNEKELKSVYSSGWIQ